MFICKEGERMIAMGLADKGKFNQKQLNLMGFALIELSKKSIKENPKIILKMGIESKIFLKFLKTSLLQKKKVIQSFLLMSILFTFIIFPR